MYAPYPENMMESIKKVEATRAERMATEPRRLSADEKDALLKKFHPDYNPDAFAEIKVGPNKGQKAPLELNKNAPFRKPSAQRKNRSYKNRL